MADRACLQAVLPGVEIRGKAMPYASDRGNMFAFVSGEGEVCLRLSAADRETFAAAHGATAVIQHGAVLKDYVALPATLAADEARAWGARASGHAATLKSKATTRAKK